MTTAVYPPEVRLIYPVLGLLGEAGEVAEKVMKELFPNGYPSRHLSVMDIYDTLERCVVCAKEAERLKKAIRDTGFISDESATDIKKRVDTYMEWNSGGRWEPTPVEKELGDCLWYCAAIARDIGATLGRIMGGNLDKLAARKQANTIHGSGDNR